ncbi:MAG: succinate dehydrogenase assembly factor 2 [Chromatium okenii]|nr:succinate dehydrogenase assembly factor 2 [Chromatium okenii]
MAAVAILTTDCSRRLQWNFKVPNTVKHSEEFRRLRWQCRRGMLELDDLLEQFLDLGYSELNAAQRHTFTTLLAAQDTQLSDWLMARATPDDPQLRDLVERIIAVAQAQW